MGEAFGVLGIMEISNTKEALFLQLFLLHHPLYIME